MVGDENNQLKNGERRLANTGRKRGVPNRLTAEINHYSFWHEADIRSPSVNV
jgi:hypothetical protein